MNPISISLNGESLSIAHSSTLEELLDQRLRDKSDGPIASAVNGQHVARQARSAFVLNDGDEVTTFEPISGG